MLPPALVEIEGALVPTLIVEEFRTAHTSSLYRIRLN